ncbi:MAG: glycosyltransferase, partial [Bacteroidota bacterium]
MKIPNNKTKLSVCIISKNEEKMLTECLESVTRIADEIIVVDTGSTDRTIEIAEKFGCRIYKEEWNNDFAYARNSAIAKARYPFILSIDADERLANPEKLKQILEENNGNIGGWLIKIISDINRANGGTDTHRSFQVRLFRNHLHFRFKGIIHEQIADSILKSGFRIEKTNLKIKHIGYSYSQEQMEQKQIRNLELLNLALTQKPDDSYVLFQRAKTFLVLNKLDEAEKDIIQALRYSNNDFTLKSQILNYGAMIAFRKRNFTSALQMVNETLLI